MLIVLLNKFLIALFFLSCLVVIRHGYYFIQAFMTSTEEIPVKYKLSSWSLFFLGTSISYILTVIFTGFKI